MVKGYVSIILHSHLPFVRHPEAQEPIEERWLFEAINECYIPLIKAFDKLLEEKVSFKITMSLTPTLMEMLEDQYLQTKYIGYMENMLELSEKELTRTEALEDKIHATAKFYNVRLLEAMKIYKNYEGNLLKAFIKYDKLGCIEFITSSATHCFLPLISHNSKCVEAQLELGIQKFTEVFSHAPKGIWLPECAYYKGLDAVLQQYNIKYFITESTAVTKAESKPLYGTYSPMLTASGVFAFPRDFESSHQVWSSILGYPSDINYREFYRDIAYELPIDYIKPYIHSEGIRIDTGFKYHRITGNTENKQYYEREKAEATARKHAKHFSTAKNAQISVAEARMQKAPLITCPYDTELFGHWWFEGPDFLYEFIKCSSEAEANYSLISPGDYLKQKPNIQKSQISPSSWGANGDYSVWLNPSNDWIYKKVHHCEKKMLKLAEKYVAPTETQERALNQAARELMLAEASDWAFIINNKTSVKYAENRFNSHVQRFSQLFEQLTKADIDLEELNKIEQMDNIFKNISYKLYADQPKNN